jgi:hypothetical protein
LCSDLPQVFSSSQFDCFGILIIFHEFIFGTVRKTLILGNQEEIKGLSMGLLASFSILISITLIFSYLTATSTSKPALLASRLISISFFLFSSRFLPGF